MFAIYLTNHPAILNNGYTVTGVGNVVQTAANKGVLLALVAMAQTFVVLTAGIDLSVGAIFILANCVASYIVVGSPLTVTAGVVGVLATGRRLRRGQRRDRHLWSPATDRRHHCLGRRDLRHRAVAPPLPRLQPRVCVRPGKRTDRQAVRHHPDQPRLPAIVVVLVWIPFRRSVLGRAVYAVGSSEVAAYMSGMPVKRAKFTAYVLSGTFAALAGLFLTFFTYSGEASAANGNTYTLYSIAAVVLGGVSLFGGRGSAIGAIFGALAFRAIGDLLFVFEVDPLWQPLFQGVVLLIAVSIGSARLFRVRNRLELFG